MGVRDLNAVAKRYAPDSITTYASIRDFRGKTLAIDANLVTTKFHFANPYPLENDPALVDDDDELAGHRHARAWYYFLRRLKANDISPIVVFDGATRLDAKARENERRRLAREVQRLRGEAEHIRGERLRTIHAVLAGIDRDERDEFVESFRDKAREILNDHRAARSRQGQEPGQDARDRVGAVADELAKLDADRKRVRELIEAFERIVQAGRAGSPSSIHTSPSPAPPTHVPSSSEAGDEPSAQASSQEAGAPSQLTPPDADIGIDDEAATAARAAAPPSLEAKGEETTAQETFHDPDQVVVRIGQTPEAVPEHLDRGGGDEGPLPLESTPVVLQPPAPAVRPLASSSTLESESTAVSPVRESVDSGLWDEEAVARTAIPVEEEKVTSPALDDPATAGTAQPVAPSSAKVGSRESVPIQDTFPAEPPPVRVQEPPTEPELPPPPAPPPPPTTSPVQTLASLFEAHLADATNPIYSRNQIDVFRKEADFFSSLVRLAATTGPAEEEASSPDADADASLAREMLHAIESQGESASSASLPGESQEQLQEQEQESTENAAAEAASTDQPPPPTSASHYEDDLHPIIERSTELQRSHDQRSRGISPAAFREVRTLIEALGVPWLQPTPDHPHEAEGVCAALQQHGLADLVISEDTDVVVYGAPVLRNITLADQPKVPMNVLDPVKLREALGMSKAEFVDLAILLGTDFTERIKGLGPVSALKAVRKYRSIENVLIAVSDRFRLDETFTAAYLATTQTARDIFLNLPPLPRRNPLPPATSDGALAEDELDLGAAASNATTEATTYLGTLQPTEPSPILPLLLAKYGVRHVSPSLEFEGFFEDAFNDDDDDDDIGSTLVEDEGDVEFNWDDLDGLDLNLVSGTGTVDDVVETGDFAVDSTLPDRDAVATTSTRPPIATSLDTVFEQLYL